VTDVKHIVLSTRPARELKLIRCAVAAVALCALSSGLVVASSHPAGASNLSNERAKANILLRQINHMNGEVALLGQKYDEALIKLHKYNNEIADTKAAVAAIEANENKGQRQLRADVVFAYVTNGANEGDNPLFTKNASKVGAANVYSQLAAGNISNTISNLKSDRIRLAEDRGILNAEDRNARSLARAAAHSLNKGNVIQADLNQSLKQVKGQIATFVSEAEAAAAAASSSTLNSAQPTSNFPAPPPDSRANIAIDAAESYLGVPYVWGGASRSGVDCSGLVMLAYEAAGIDFPHYSGAQYEDTERVPLYDIEPGDLLFYGPGGDEHVAMYVGNGEMIEAPETGEVVHITPVRLYGDFVGLGRPR
jgi:cell wall-associated NlpC family hydrolase